MFFGLMQLDTAENRINKPKPFNKFNREFTYLCKPNKIDICLISIRRCPG